MSEIIIGRNAVLEALRSDREIEKINILKDTDGRNHTGSIKQIIAIARDKKVPVYYSDKAFMDRLLRNNISSIYDPNGYDRNDPDSSYRHEAAENKDSSRYAYKADRSGKKDGHNGHRSGIEKDRGRNKKNNEKLPNYQGVIAIASDYKYCETDDILNLAGERGEPPFIIILDGLEDPHNLGAVMRTAECAGAHGVIIPKRRSVSVNETVLKTSAGAAEHILCARVTNIGQTIDYLKEKGVWVYACDMGDDLMYSQDFTGSAAIVIGSEGFGISRLVKEKCDVTVSIPMKGKINSLNASNAAAILMYEIVKQRL